MALTENEQSALFQLKKMVSDHYHLRDFKLFGSKAQGLDVVGSDIDIMIELEEVTPEINAQIADLVFEINLANDCFISPVLFSSQELNQGPMDQSPLYRAIQKHGIAL